MPKSPSSDPKKATIYIDVDDEITAIIDKLSSAPQKIVALVLPKRAKVLQSIVNMRLLKRACEKHHKSLVLITSESTLMPLAAAVGVHVAKTLTSKPAIPSRDEPPTTDVVSAPVSDEPELDPKAPVGALVEEEVDMSAEDTSTVSALAAPLTEEQKADIETVELDDEASETPTSKTKKLLKDKKLTIPNFNKFRLWIFLGVSGLVALIVLWYFAVSVLPSGVITIKTETSTANSVHEVTALASLKAVDVDKKQVPLVVKTAKSTQTGTFQATGQKDVGTKAGGTMTVTNCINDGQPHTIPAGTTFTNGAYSFVANNDVALDPALFSGSTCKSADFGLSEDVAVTAAQPGDSYNVSARSYSSSINGVTGYGSAMSGGVTKMLKVVSDEDIENAKKTMLSKSNDAVKKDLTTQLESAKALAATDSFNPTAGAVITSIKSGEEATGDVSISVEITYAMYGIANTDISAVMKPEILKQIDADKQKFVGDIAKSTKLKLTNRKSEAEVVFTATTDLVIGAKIETEALKKQLAGDKQWDAERSIKALPGVQDVTIKLSPFWVHNIPKKTGKVTVKTLNADGKTQK